MFPQFCIPCKVQDIAGFIDTRELHGNLRHEYKYVS